MLAVVVLVLANGFFVAAEFSLVAVRRSRVQQLVDEGHPRAPALHRATTHLDAYLAATQLGITTASIGLGWVGEPVLAGIIEPALHVLPTSWELLGAEILAIAAAFALVTILHIVLGDLVPKSLALQRAERTALVASTPLELFLTVFRPAILLLNGLGNRTVQLFGLEPGGGEDGIHSVEELQLLVAASRSAGLVSEEAEDIVERAFRLDDLAARQVMVPRVAIVGVPVEAAPAEAVAIAVDTHLPVYRGRIDDIVGVVNVLDLVKAGTQGSLEDVMRPALLVPQTVRADVLLGMMRARGQQLAICGNRCEAPPSLCRKGRGQLALVLREEMSLDRQVPR